MVDVGDVFVVAVLCRDCEDPHVGGTRCVEPFGAGRGWWSEAPQVGVWVLPFLSLHPCLEVWQLGLSSAPGATLADPVSAAGQAPIWLGGQEPALQLGPGCVGRAPHRCSFPRTGGRLNLFPLVPQGCLNEE